MRSYNVAVAVVVAVSVALASDFMSSSTPVGPGSPRPTVIWHGMGDNCCDPLSMGAVKKEIEESIPGIYVYSVMIGKNPEEDTFEGFFSNVNDQIDFLCGQAKADPHLQYGFNAIGFSQGSQFLRAYVERCNDPPVHNLITFGGQHQGVSEVPGCIGTNETLCEMMAKVIGEGVYMPIVRDYSVQAQYFKDPLQNAEYLKYNQFLVDINNAGTSKNATYKANLETLDNFVLIMFENDTIVIPRESEYFGAYALGSLTVVQTLFEQQIYTEDWIGLQTLNNAGKLVFLKTPGEHMQFTMEYLHDAVIVPYLNQTLSVDDLKY